MGRARAGKDSGRAVAVVNVAVDCHGGANLVVALHAADGDRNVVNHAEALAMVRESVVEAAANIDSDAVFESMVRRQNRSARRQPERLHQLRRVGDLHLHFFARGERACLQLLHVLRLVDQQNVLIGSRLRGEEIRRFGDSGFKQAVMNPPILFRRKDVLADREIVFGAVDELKGEHGRGFPII